MSMYVCIPDSPNVAWNTPARKVSDSAFAYGGVWYTVVIPDEFDTGEPNPDNLLIVSQSELFETEQPEADTPVADEDTESADSTDTYTSDEDEETSTSTKSKSKAKAKSKSRY